MFLSTTEAGKLLNDSAIANWGCAGVLPAEKVPTNKNRFGFYWSIAREDFIKHVARRIYKGASFNRLAPLLAREV